MLEMVGEVGCEQREQTAARATSRSSVGLQRFAADDLERAPGPHSELQVELHVG